MNFRGALSWLGLIADNDAYQPKKDNYEEAEYQEEYDDAEPELEPEPKPAPVSQPVSTTIADNQVASVTSARRVKTESQTVPQLVADIAKIVSLKPRSYAESARVIGENFKEGAPVIINLAEMDDIEAKQLLAFAGGLTFGLEGKLERINKTVFVLSPSSIMIASSDKQRIADGFYNQN